MNIFLDSNALYKDPFLRKGFNKTLNRMARHEDVKMYINQTVYKEVLRGHKDFLEKELNAANNALTKISPYLNEEKQKFVINVELNELLEDFEIQFKTLQDEGKLEIIKYDADVLEHVVDMDMYDKNPFIKKQEIENKGGDIVRFSKKEVRDAIIWYSYQTFIKKNELENCYFISNNTKEFGDVGANKTAETEPYTLHPELAEDTNLILYKTIKGFLVHNDEQVKELFEDINTQISERLYEIVEEELEEGLAAELVTKFLTGEISSFTQDFLRNKEPERIHQDYFIGGYVDPSMEGVISGIRLNELEVYGDEITVAVDVDVEMEVEIYLYNPVWEDRDEKFEYYGTDTVKVEESIVFVIPLGNATEINEETFTLKQHVYGIELSNVNIEVIDWKNIDHTDMFPDDYSEENN
ncbi:PIN domain-containing protein [Cytobacillus oceanisediminis]|uniref:DUF4935 domain-containing protein n=1 Tax=Cytobacillus oceanisediminis 2691 TaxID=1196031 RepID=A0A169FW23_9BACI|nr:PIN domain-containing protein [Cytobacillus oceanisediminis]AND41421.1 hypothetical protein A361_20400 [Cytobacillus oceanisediminis 2691]